MKERNPFIISGYSGPEFFCDREKETLTLINNAANGVNTTLISIRRMGKSGLIWHTFDRLNRSGSHTCIYSDIYATQDLRDFTNKLGSAILRALPEKKPAGKKFMSLLKGLRPVFSYDALSGQPQVSFTFASEEQYEQSIESLFRFLDSQKQPVLLAIDEFQQISSYPEKNMEALLRSQIQTLENVNLIFSGSSHHLLSEIFSNGKRPFFASTQFLYLKEIERNIYKDFIKIHMTRNEIKIDDEALDYIMDFSRAHTFYTQSICNRLFASGLRRISIDAVIQVCNRLLEEYEQLFLQYRNLLTPVQWNILEAIAKEGRVYKPTAKVFLEKYKIGIPANIQRGLESLLKKEMIFRENDKNGAYYSVYDLFLSRWLENLE
ncbi:MAG: ATP-binding protein [Bacteroidales bacterium]|nr:ATP-binding protein [Bacteroidales bacterium]